MDAFFPLLLFLPPPFSFLSLLPENNGERLKFLLFSLSCVRTEGEEDLGYSRAWFVFRLPLLLSAAAAVGCCVPPAAAAAAGRSRRSRRSRPLTTRN